MDTIKKIIIDQHDMVDAIRIRKHTDCTVEYLRSILGISRTTADKNYNSLLTSGVIQRSERSTTMCNDCAYFLGISIGSVNIRIILLGLDFEPVELARFDSYEYIRQLKSIPSFNENECGAYSYAYSVTEQTDGEDNRNDVSVFSSIQDTVEAIVTLFLKQVEAARAGNGDSFPLMGIGFGVTGPVDYARAVWMSSPRIDSVHEITIRDLIRHTNMELAERLGIFFSIDNNAKAAIVSEYQYLVEKAGGNFDDDLALIYIGTGVGSAVVINKRLLRGRQNYSGELGHAFMPSEGPRLITIEQSLRNKQDYQEKLPFILHMLNCMLGIDRFILVGHSMFEYIGDDDNSSPDRRIHLREDLLPHLMDRRMRFTVSSTKKYCLAEEGRGTPTTAAFGAAIEAYRTMCGYDYEHNRENRTNLAFDISW